MNELRILANIIPGKIDTNFEEQKSSTGAVYGIV